MKKNISINISGIIFHVEEDGYEKLKNYLDSVNKYFSAYEDSKEITEDIEGRIAEIFLMKLNDNKQVINLEDIEALISTMGTTADFDATIDVDEDLAKEVPPADTEDKTDEFEHTSKRLYRSLNQKLIGGVATGIARYFSVDQLWIRILLLSLLVFPLIAWPAGAISFLTLVTYVLLWIILPGKEFEEDQHIKKLFRDPEEKILGGVSGGLANYFGIDKVAVRILFVIGIPLGFIGPVLYVIIWIITPEASSITEKLEMQGEPVTLSSIESNIKKELNEDEEGEEKLFVKLLLFPFRFIALIIKAISNLLTPFIKFIFEAVRVVFGAGITIAGISVIVATCIFMLSYHGALGDIPVFVFNRHSTPASYLKGIIDNSTLIFGAISLVIPALFVAMLGISIIVRRMIIKSYIGWSLGGIWLLGIIGFAISLPQNLNKFDKRDIVKVVNEYDLTDKTPVLELNDLYGDIENVSLSLRGHEADNFKLVVNYEARGNTRRAARDKAKQIAYYMEQRDSIFIFDSNINIPDVSVYEYSMQQASVIFYLPYNRPFRIDPELGGILHNTLHLSGYRAYQLEGNEWVFNNEGKIACLTCDEGQEQSESFRPFRKKRPYRSGEFSLDDYNGRRKEFIVSDFDIIEANGVFEIEVVQGSEYSVVAKGSNRLMDRINVNSSGGVLSLDFEGKLNWFRRGKSDKIGVIVTLPELTEANLSGASEMYIRQFEVNKINIDLFGASFLDGDLNASSINLDLSGASKVILNGNAEEIDVEMGGASSLKADRLNAQSVKVDVSGASRATVWGESEMYLEASGLSKITYSGPGKVIKRRSGASNIRKD